MLTIPTDKTETRRIKRIAISLPVRVDGKDENKNDWDELTRTTDVSVFGAGFVLDREIKCGRLLKLTLPMPQRMRTFDFTETQYKVWGVVTECKNDPKPKSFIVGVAFTGKYPPSSYLENPLRIYDFVSDPAGKTNKIVAKPETATIHNSTEDNDAERQNETPERRHSRFEIPLNVTVKVVGRNDKNSEVESTVTGNISHGGAEIFSFLDLEIGSKLEVTSDQYRTNLHAIVRGKHTGPDQIRRLNVEFIGGVFPLPGIDSAT